MISNVPSHQNVHTDASLATATVYWTPPTASDNSGEAVTLTSDYSPGDNFIIGNTTVVYTVVDTYGNGVKYSFDVVVRGKLTIIMDPKVPFVLDVSETFA